MLALLAEWIQLVARVAEEHKRSEAHRVTVRAELDRMRHEVAKVPKERDFAVSV